MANFVAAHAVYRIQWGTPTDSYASSSGSAVFQCWQTKSVWHQQGGGCSWGCHGRDQAGLQAAAQPLPLAQPSPARTRCPAQLQPEAIAVSGHCVFFMCAWVLPTGHWGVDSKYVTTGTLEFFGHKGLFGPQGTTALKTHVLHFSV